MPAEAWKFVGNINIGEFFKLDFFFEFSECFNETA